MLPESVFQVVFPKKEQAVLQQTPFDTTPLRDDEAAGPVLSSIISTGTELGMQYHAPDGFPHYPGYGSVFEVSELGSAVSGVKPGDRLFCIGKHASYQRCGVGDTVKVPDGLDPLTAVITRMSGIGWSAVTLAEARPPGLVLVIGLGMVGYLAAHIFRRCGYRVGAVDPDKQRRELLRNHAEAVFESIPVGDPVWQDRVDLVIDCSGHEEAVYQACCIVKPGGEVAAAGVPWEPRSQRLCRDLLWKIFWRYVHLKSGWEWEVPWHSAPFRKGSFRQNCAETMEWMSRGDLDVNGLYRTTDPRNCQQVYQELRDQPADILSSVFDWSLIGS
jgi:threonine dehydrogenase-like Zn-dependent dehydrogenase